MVNGIKLFSDVGLFTKNLKYYVNNKKKKNIQLNKIAKRSITKKINVTKVNKFSTKRFIKNLKNLRRWNLIVRVLYKARSIYFGKLRCWNKLQFLYKSLFLRKSKFYRWVDTIKNRRILYIHFGIFNLLTPRILFKLKQKKLKQKKLKLKKLKLKNYKLNKKIRPFKKWGSYLYSFIKLSKKRVVNCDNIFIRKYVWMLLNKKFKKKILKPVISLILNSLVYKKSYTGKLVVKKADKINKRRLVFRNYFKMKKININYLNVKHLKYIQNKNILNYIFMNDYSVKSFYINFYKQTKLNSSENTINTKLKKKTYLFNIWKNKLTSYKKARCVHWETYKKGTIKKRRYKNFLYFFLRNTKKYINSILLFFVIKFKLSYIFWTNFTKMYLYFFKKKIITKCIYQLPISLSFWSYINLHIINKKKIKKKIKKWIFVKIRTKRTFWMNRKRKIPKFFTKQIFVNKQIQNSIQYDFLTNYFFIVKNRDNSINSKNVIFDNKLLKLHDFRYKA